MHLHKHLKRCHASFGLRQVRQTVSPARGANLLVEQVADPSNQLSMQLAFNGII